MTSGYVTGLAARGTRGAVLPLAAALLVAGCDPAESLLEVRTPDQITPEQAEGVTGAAAMRVAAIGNFAQFYGGDVGGSFHGVNITSGLLTDEMESARGGTEHLDSRAQNEAVQPLTTTWVFVGQTTTQNIRARKALDQYLPTSTAAEQATKATQIAQLHALQGMTFVILGENYCNGIPIANANDLEPQTETLSNLELFNRAIAQFDSAITVLGTTSGSMADSIRNLVAVGRGRALLDRARTPAEFPAAVAAAAQAVATVPNNFVYMVGYSETTIINAIYDWMFGTLNYAPAESEGTNGLNYVSARDPRVTVQRNADGTPVRRAGQDGLQHYIQTNYTRGSAPLVLASGVEARLIEAEAALQRGDAGTYLTKINDARATRTDLTPLTLPVGQRAQEDLLFRERAFWFWGTAHRLGDLRRLIRQYGRTQDQVFPIGSYFKGGNYGSDVTLVPAQTERNNPQWQGCTDRNA